MIVCKSELCQLMVYSSSSGNSDGGSRVGGGNCCSESTDPISDSLYDLYSELDFFLCKS